MFSHNKTSLKATCGGGGTKKLPLEANQIIENMASNAYNNTRDNGF